MELIVCWKVETKTDVAILRSTAFTFNRNIHVGWFLQACHALGFAYEIYDSVKDGLSCINWQKQFNLGKRLYRVLLDQVNWSRWILFIENEDMSTVSSVGVYILTVTYLIYSSAIWVMGLTNIRMNRKHWRLSKYLLERNTGGIRSFWEQFQSA